MKTSQNTVYRDKMRRRRVRRAEQVKAGLRISPRGARTQMAAPIFNHFTA